MVAPEFAKTDAGLQALMNALDEQERSMTQANSTVEGIHADITGHYTGPSARTFLGKISEWQEQYRRMIQQVGTVIDATAHANRSINQAQDEALANAQAWSAGSDSIQAKLAG